MKSSSSDGAASHGLARGGLGRTTDEDYRKNTVIEGTIVETSMSRRIVQSARQGTLDYNHILYFSGGLKYGEIFLCRHR